MNLTSLKLYFLHLKSHISWLELSGSLGDLGTLIPILITLSKSNQISLSSSLFFGGLWNILTGLIFKIPMCVQPMKAIAASALTNKLTLPEVMSAGLFVSSVVAFLGLSRTLGYLNKFIPLPVIRGIQLGAGLLLSIKACEMTQTLSFVPPLSWANNYYYFIVCFFLVFLFYFNLRIPSAFILFTLGLFLTILYMALNHIQGPYFSLFNPAVTVPSSTEFKNGIIKAGLGQLPLTLLNSVIALAALADDLFPNKAPHSINHIAISVGAMNLIGCFFGSVPYCHGSGGLAGQYRFGARSEVSIIVLGVIKLLLGLILGDSLLSSISNYPTSILAVLLFVCGLELSAAAKNFSRHEEKERKDRDFTVLLVTSALQLGFKSDAIGFLGGMVVAYTFIMLDVVSNRNNNSSEWIPSPASVEEELNSESFSIK
ncbi:hypothetical protein K502DRAFT_311982 [Neoconidiobolus thromboides FSU 785]|nr:hypothetical protein K502DRAFT_311982 [Neoconidiobolus thromboides FSU 785]